MTLRAWIVLAALAVAAASAGFEYVRQLQARLATAAAQVATARQDLGTRDATIARMQADARDKDAQLAKLAHARAAVDSALTTSQQQLRNLIDGNESIRAWADRPLPGDVVRLHASPALTGADDYASRVRDGDALHDAGDAAAQ
ncbi:LysB family phage lysis regulatory protein [Burkholderia gladioli]